jgi:tape measure domain-containing protein
LPVDAGTIVTTFKGDTRDLDKAFQHGERRAGEYVNKLNSTFANIGGGRSGGLLQGLSNISNVISALPAIGQIAHAIVSPLTDAARAGIEFNATLESAKIGFEGVAGGADEAQKHIDKLLNFAAKTPFEFTGLLKASRYMSVFGFGLDEQIPKLTAWGNAIAATGDISEDVLEGIVRAFGQMTAKGKVSAEEMEQLAERGIPSWELLAKAIGKTVAETRKLSEQGRLKGRPAVEAITAMMEIDPRYKDQMARQSQTFAGRVSNYQDLYAQATGMATQNLFADINSTMEAGLKQSGTAEAMAQSINTAIAPVSGMIKIAATGLLGGGITAGLTEGIKAGKEAVENAAMDLGLGVISSFKGILGIESPSKVFYDFGMMTALGFYNGLQDGIQKQGTNIKTREGDTLKIIAARMGVPLEQLTQRYPRIDPDQEFDPGQTLFVPNRIDPQRGQQKMRRSSESLVNKYTALIEESARKNGVDPDIIRAIMSIESQGHWNAVSPAGAKGLMQLMPGTAKRFGVQNIFDPAQNIEGGTRFLRFLMNAFSGNLDLVAAGYNAGEGNVNKYHGIPPFKETRNYVAKFRSLMSSPQAGGDLGEIYRRRSEPSGGLGEFYGRIPESGGDLTGNGIFRTSGSGLPSASAMAGPGRSAFDLFGQSNVERQLFQTQLALHNIGDEVQNVGDKFNSTKPGAGEWFNAVAGGGINVLDSLKQIENKIPGLSEQLKGMLIDIPEQSGRVFGDAARQWDGTFHGLFQSIGLGFADMLRQMSAQLIESGVTKLLSSLLGSVIGGLFGGGGKAGSLGSIFAGGGAGGVGGHANGGFASGWSVVGERGPELAYFGGGAQIYSNHDSQKMMGTTNVTNIINVPVARSSGYSQRKSRRQLGQELMRAIL